MATPLTDPPSTPDGGYSVARGRSWRESDSALPPDTRRPLAQELMAARHAVQDARRHDDLDVR